MGESAATIQPSNPLQPARGVIARQQAGPTGPLCESVRAFFKRVPDLLDSEHYCTRDMFYIEHPQKPYLLTESVPDALCTMARLRLV